VTRAALRAAQEAHTPLLYAATLNQVDRNGGYTGWTPDALAAFVTDEADRLGVDVPVFFGLDHGGPWAKDAHANAELAPDAAMTEAKRSVTACIEAGYDLLHLDPAAGPPNAPSDPLPLDTLVERTLTLLRHAETIRHENDRGPLAYEVGTDEARGGLQSPDRMRSFLNRLHAALDAHDLPRPSFVVGDLGTRLDSGAFDAARARRFVAAAEETGTLVKGHYTDDVTTPSDYPLSGVGGANVGPGLSAVEAEAVRALAELESELGHDSRMVNTLRSAVVESGRWTKWLRPDEQGTAFPTCGPIRRYRPPVPPSTNTWPRTATRRPMSYGGSRRPSCATCTPSTSSASRIDWPSIYLPRPRDTWGGLDCALRPGVFGRTVPSSSSTHPQTHQHKTARDHRFIARVTPSASGSMLRSTRSSS
jgi:hypothetical protein